MYHAIIFLLPDLHIFVIIWIGGMFMRDVNYISYTDTANKKNTDRSNFVYIKDSNIGYLHA